MNRAGSSFILPPSPPPPACSRRSGARPEHIDDDDRCFAECFRILKPGGKLLVLTPYDGPFMLLNKVKTWVGLDMDAYDHFREGYHCKGTRRQLARHGFVVERCSSYCRFCLQHRSFR